MPPSDLDVVVEPEPEPELDLPDECWQLVFENLGDSRLCWQSLSLTCRRFLRLSNRTRPSLTITSSCGSLGLPRILSRFEGVREIDLSKFHGSLSRPLEAIAHAGLPLRVLNLQGQKAMPWEAIQLLGFKCPQLKELNCSKFQTFRNEDLAITARSFPQLEILDISYPQHRLRLPPNATNVPGLLTDKGVQVMAASLKHLRSLNLSGHHLLTDLALEALASRCRELEELTVFDCPSITDRGLQLLAIHCFKLTTLAVNGRRVTAAGIEGIISSTNKRLLCLNLCHMNLTDEVLEQLTEPPWYDLSHCSTPGGGAAGGGGGGDSSSAFGMVDSSDTESLSDGVVPDSPAGCSSSFDLRSFDGGYSLASQQGGAWPISVNDALGSSGWTSPLTKLVLAYCKGLTSLGLLHVAQGCPHLRHLDLEGSHFLQDDDTAELAKRVPDLNFLRLNHCSMLTDITFVSVLKHCPHLETLEMEATAVGWGTEITLCQRQFRLQHLNLAWNRAVGDDILEYIAKLCPALVSLDLSNCLPVTGAGLKMIGRGCPHLAHLVLKGCKNVHSLEGVLENTGMIIENRCTMSENQGRVLENWGKMKENGGRSMYESKADILEHVGFTELEHLELEDSGFTDAGLVAVSRHSRNLGYLGLGACKVSDGGLKSVMEECKQLRQLNLKDCIGISGDALAWMVFCRPSLRKLVLPCLATSEGERARLTRHGCELIKHGHN